MGRQIGRDEMKKMMLKACQRCGGDLLLDASDREGQTMVCLQCGVEVPLRRVMLQQRALRAAAPMPKAA